MKVVNCETIRTQIEEADFGSRPDDITRKHLHRCDPCQRFYEEQQALRQLMAGFPSVVAPADFDFRLRARLRKEKPAFALGRFSLGIRAATLAALLLLIGAAFWYRHLQTTQTINESARIIVPQSAAPVEKSPAAIDPRTIVQVDSNAGPTKPTPVRKQQRVASVKQSEVIARTDRKTTKDLSSMSAAVIRSEPKAGSVFPIDASYDSLKLSLDYSSGVSRTISLPRVSFGSQRMLAGDPNVKTSTKGVW